MRERDNVTAAVALYARVSTANQAEKALSIPDQLQQMRGWCKSQGFHIAAEYIESGASAVDDKRPVFRRMVADATAAEHPVDAIIVHSLSRFFRDALGFGLCERELNKAGVKLFSITQQTSDDPSGEMVRKILNVFDEYQSKENGKHTLRAMKENARQGFFNGATPPFGFRTVTVESRGNREKKRLEVHPAEAAIVRKIFELYLNGYVGLRHSAQGIAMYLNDRRMTHRGKAWAKNRVQEIFTNPIYFGKYCFNKHDAKAGKMKPQTEWICFAIEPIVDASTFQQIQDRRATRELSPVSRSATHSPTLLTGLLKCASCGAGMTLATGKSGRYKYYKCYTRTSRGRDACNSNNIPMEKLDELVLSVLTRKLSPLSGVQKILRQIERDQNGERFGYDREIKLLNQRRHQIRVATSQSFRVVEAAEAKHGSSRINKASRQAVLIQVNRQNEKHSANLKAGQVEALSKKLNLFLLGKRLHTKQYLRLLISEIQVHNNKLEIGYYPALAQAVTQQGRNTKTD